MMAQIQWERIPVAVTDLCRRLHRAGHEAYLVGGGVRDLLLGRPVHDWDVATSATPRQVRRLFPKTIPIGIEHGTVAVVLSRELQVEVTTYRGEGAYSDGRRPDSVHFVTSLEEDLERRDLTINAMALDAAEQRLVDPMDGQADLRRRLVRAVGDPAARFSEDGLRPLRAIRFAAVLEFEVEPATLAAVRAALPSFRKVSMERVRDELLKIMVARTPSRAVELMRQSGLLELVLPELLAALGVSQNRYHGEDVYQHMLRSCDALDPAPEGGEDPVLRLTALLHDVGKPATARAHPQRPGEQSFHGHETVGADLCRGIGARLRLSRHQSERMSHLVQQHNFPLTGLSAAGIRRLIRRVGPEHLQAMFALRRADLCGRDGPDQLPELRQLWQRAEAIQAQRPALSTRDLALDGRQIMAHLGLQPGPLVGIIMRGLLEQVLDDPDLNQEETLLRLAGTIAREAEQRPGDGD